MKDLTIIFMTASLVPEEWGEYQRSVLVEASEGAPIISVSRKPLDFGFNMIDDGEKCTDNIYRQMLKAFKLADTPFVAMAEDDTLYPPGHFSFHRPAADTFSYNKNRLTLFTWVYDPPWDKAMYHWRDRLSNCTLIAPRKLAIEALTERYKKWPNGIPENRVGELGRGMVDRNLGVTERKCEVKFSKLSVVQVNHDYSSEERQRKHRKSFGPVKAFDIPHWGKAEDLVKRFK